MALKDEYNKTISLRCLTCGASYAFEVDDVTGYVTCHKCNRVYYGGEEELIDLNRALIEDEKALIVEEVQNDIAKEFMKTFKI